MQEAHRGWEEQVTEPTPPDSLSHLLAKSETNLELTLFSLTIQRDQIYW
jgi:hypothetical protein